MATSDADRSMTESDRARREFLRKCGRFAVVTPPVVTLLLSTSLDSPAVAASGTSGAGGGSPDRFGGNCNLLCRFVNIFD